MSLQKFVESIGLDVDTEPIEAAVRARGLEGAQFVGVTLAAAAFVHAGEENIEQAIDSAITEIGARLGRVLSNRARLN